jgi:signal transduction histidine kinase
VNDQNKINDLFKQVGLGLTTADTQAAAQAATRAVRKTIRRTIISVILINLGCLALFVGVITCVVLGCLKLFGVL